MPTGERESGKQRALRVPLDYYKKPDRLQRWKGLLAIVAAFAGLGWFLFILVRPGEGRSSHSPGAVAAVHATWNDNCDACHQPFRPISGDAWLSPWLNRSGSATAQCRSCHSGAIHHSKQADDGSNCASCHHEHRGREAALVQMADHDCTRCHNDLAANVKTNEKLCFDPSVSAFDTEHHPEFRLLRKANAPSSDERLCPEQSAPPDPRRLTFKHRVHMQPGMNADFRLKSIPDAEDRKRYAADPSQPVNLEALVQLQCASCHRAEARDFFNPSTFAASGRSDGAYMAPITYENQCRACHPLTFDRKSKDDPTSPLLSVPHGLQPKAVRDYLWGAYANEYVAKAARQARKGPDRPLPSNGLQIDDEQARRAIDREVARTQTYLYRAELSRAEEIMFGGRQTCGECHQFEPARFTGTPEHVAPVSIPPVWYRHALFDHTAHRAVSCRECHAQAYANADPERPMLPGRDTCLECHSRSRTTAEGPRGGARSDCVECHRYHNGDEPLHGVAAARRGVGDDPARTLREFLSGSPAQREQKKTGPQSD